MWRKAEVQADDGDRSGTWGFEGMWGVGCLLGVIRDREEDSEVVNGGARSFGGCLLGLCPRKLLRRDYLFQTVRQQGTR